MAVPGYQDFMLPLLQLTADGQEHAVAESADQLADQLKLTAEDRKEMLPSGTMTRLMNRVHWACTYLRKSGLLETTRRSHFRLAKRGSDALAQKLKRIDNDFLSQFPEFVEFKTKKSNGSEPDIRDSAVSLETPAEIMESGYQNLRHTLAEELLERVRKCSPSFFERMVVDLLVAMGYGGSRQDAGAAVGRSGDDGVDGIIKEDKLGLDAVYIQAKRWENPVGRPVVQSFAGSLEGHRARKGVLITTSQFSAEAREYVTRIEKKIVLIGGEQLAQFMIDHGIGVSEVATYTVKKVDADYFGDE
jgi:restriction system protein